MQDIAILFYLKKENCAPYYDRKKLKALQMRTNLYQIFSDLELLFWKPWTESSLSLKRSQSLS